ncbi:hypothetical protein H0A64_07170 [Alcaligenaceae bacterium]|nr:hypothetical protein [Alcaligenaceae bacterium]
MSDIYDQLLDQQTPSPIAVEPSPLPPAPKKDPYDTLLDQQQAMDARAADAQLERAAQVKPDRAAQVRDLAKSSGLPVDLVERNFERVQRRDRALKMRSLLASSPVLAKQMQAPEFAGVAHDDVDNLAAIERAIRTHGELKTPAGPEASFGSVAGGLGTAAANMFPALREGLRLQFADTFGLDDMQRDAMRRAANVQMSNTLASPQFETSTGQGLYGGAVSVIHMLPSIAAAIATRSPGVGLTVLGMQTQAQEYPKYRLRGGTPGEAALGATLESGIEVATEMLPMSFLVKNLGKMGLGQFVSGFIGREALTEQVATLTQDAVDTAIANPDKTWSEYAAERPDAAYQTLLGTLVASGVFGGMNTVARRMAGREEDVRISEEGAQLIENLNKLAAASELQKIDAGSFAAFVEQAAQEGPLQDVYIDANTLMQSGLAEQVAAVSPSVADQLETAAQTGGTIKIPVAEYAATIAPTDFAQPLLDHLKVDPDGFSRLEAQAYMQSATEQLEQEVEQAVAGQQADSAARASVEVVRENIKAQLDTANRFTPQVNDAYASMVGEFYAAQAARMGITPEAMFERYPLRVVAENVADGQQFDQAAVDTPEFREWFGDSKVVDEAGAPLVVYHGTKSDVTGFQLGKAKRRDAGWFGDGFYLSGSSELASSYAMREADHSITERPANVMPLYVKLENPYRIDLSQLSYDEGSNFTKKFGGNDGFKQWLSENGYDGVIGFRDPEIAGEGAQHWEVVVFDPAQIKSATGNRGTFDANDPNILHQSGQPQLMAVHNISADNLLFADEMGGLAVPSVGVVTEDAGSVEGFGEITLIGTRPLVDPAQERVFSSDAYTARFPKPEYGKVKTKQADQITESIRAIAKEFDDRSIVYESFDYMVNTPNAAKVLEMWMGSAASRAKFLREQGIDAQPVMSGPRSEMGLSPEQLATLEPLFNVVVGQQVNDVYDTPEAQQLSDALEAAIRQSRAEKGSRESLVDKMVAKYTVDPIRYLDAELRSFRQGPTVDTWATRDAISKQIEDNGLEAQFKRWVDEQILPAFGEPFLKVGRKKAPYTLENIVASMTDTKVKGKETTMTYGAGQARAAASVEFSDIEQMREAAKSQVVDADQYEVARKAAEEKLSAYRDAVVPFTTLTNWRGEPDTWEALDGAMRALAKWSTKKKRDAANFKAALRSEGFDTESIPDGAIGQGMDAGRALLATPVPYFEAKPQRAVGLNEFAGAVIPKDAPQEVRDTLAKHGIATAEYAGEGTRTQAVRDFARQLQDQGAGTLFQNQQAPRGFFSPETSTIGLLKAADLSTFLHESGHFFLEVQLDMAAKLTHEASGFALSEGEQQIVADANTLLQWFGVTDLSTWYGLDFEEKRSYHEQFARGFEAYLFEGKAPSIEIQGIFQRFRSWLVNVYKELKALNVELSDEVRSVMDRMLATDEQIKAAEYGRSMLPLFESAQQAGMTPEEFAAYQALGQDATADAQAQLSERGLRDMKWLSNAKSRALKRLQKEADDLRAQERVEVRREIMSQPVYRAWQFLTGKVSPDDRIKPAKPRPKSDPNTVDPSQDSLFVAIAKLGGVQRDQVQSEWGIDPKEKVAQPVFGKPVLRKTGGLTVDQMREALGEYGYLDNDSQNPNWDPNEFEWKFFDELGGSPTYSNQYDYDAASQEELAGQDLNLESVVSGRLSRPELRGMYGDAADAAWKALEDKRMVVNNGLHPDLVAELFGFTSGDELVQTLSRAQPPEVEIEALTDLRMLERHGDLATPESLARAADAAIHNDMRARVIAAEHKALNAAIGPRAVTGTDRNGRRITTALLPQAAREFAKTMVSRLKIRNVRPGQYAAAESRAAKAAEKALRAGDLEQAAAEKRNQLVNNFAAKSAHEAVDEVDKGVRYLKKFDSEGTRKSLDVDYLDQIDAMLARFDLRRGQSLRSIDKRTSLAEWIEARNNEGTEPDIAPWLAAEANREHYKNLTLEQFRGLVDAVKQIEHLGRLKHRLLTAQDKRELDAIVDDLRASINANANGRVIDNERRNTVSSTVVHAMRGFMAAHRKIANLMREMDGFVDGGPMWEFIIRPMNDAGNREASMRSDATKRLQELSRPILADGTMGGKGRFFPSVGRSLNRGERLAIALNWGNEGNRQRLLDGRGWTESQLQPVLHSLTAKEWQFVQGVWDFFESYRPEIAAKERRVMGREPEWIEATPLTVRTADGTDLSMRGGYYPIKYDTNQSGEAGAHADAEQAKAMMRAAYTAATTRRSFTKTRAEAVKGRPLLLTFDGIYQGANEVIHDLVWHEWLIDANKLLRRLDGPIRSGYGAQTATAIKRTVEDIARGDKPATNAVEASLNHLRTGATVAGLGWNLFTGMLQPLGITQSIARIGPTWVAKGVREFYGNPTQMLAKVNDVNEQSEFMRNRSRTMNREINDLQNQLTKSKPQWRTFLESSFFVFIQKLQMTVDYPTWLGAYEKALLDPANVRADGTVDEARVVRMADQVVIDAQGEGQIKDLSQVQRGHPAFKLFTNFYSYFNVAMNMATDATKRTNFKDPVQVARLAGDYLLILVLPAVLSGLLRAAIKGDDDELAKQLAEEQIDYLMGLFVGVREVSSAVKFATGVGNPAFGYTGPAGTRFFSEITRLGQQIGQGDLDTALLKATNNVAGLIFHYPAGQVQRTVDGIAALIDGRSANPMAPLVGVPRK